MFVSLNTVLSDVLRMTDFRVVKAADQSSQFAKFLASLFLILHLKDIGRLSYFFLRPIRPVDRTYCSRVFSHWNTCICTDRAVFNCKS